MKRIVFDFIFISSCLLLFGEGYQGFPWGTSRDDIISGGKKYEFEKKYDYYEVISYYGNLNDISAKFNFVLSKNKLISAKTEFSMSLSKVNIAIDR